VIADHSDAMGLVNDLAAAAPEVTKYEQGARWSKGLRTGGQAAVDTALDLITTFSQGQVDKDLLAAYSPGSPAYESVWQKVVRTAEDFNDPGTFTAMIGFEWTSLVKGNNLHRNVLFRDGAEKAGQVVPFTTQAPIGSTDPLDLYKWLENYEARTGGSVLALAHNGNLSNGLMFPVDAQYTGWTRPTSRPARSGNRCTRSRRSRATARRTRSCRPTTRSRTTRPGMSATWT